jgi:hypothetical protein
MVSADQALCVACHDDRGFSCTEPPKLDRSARGPAAARSASAPGGRGGQPPF